MSGNLPAYANNYGGAPIKQPPAYGSQASRGNPGRGQPNRGRGAPPARGNGPQRTAPTRGAPRGRGTPAPKTGGNVPAYASFGAQVARSASPQRGAPKRGSPRGAPRGRGVAAPKPVAGSGAAYASFGSQVARAASPQSKSPSSSPAYATFNAPKVPANRGIAPARGRGVPAARNSPSSRPPAPVRTPAAQNSSYSTTPNLSSFGSASSYSSVPVANKRDGAMYATQQPQKTSTPVSSSPGEHVWALIVERGTNLIAADVNGKSDPYVVAELVRAKKSNGQWTNIKTSSKTKTSTVQETLNPVWDFQVYSLKAETTWSRYQGVKLTCFDKDLIGTDDFLGEAFLWFGEEIPSPPASSKTIKVDLKSRAKKKDKVSGYLTVTSKFANTASAAAPSSRPALQSAASSGNIVGHTLKRSDLVQVSATGRREVKIPTTGVEKFVCFGELPPLKDNQTKEQKKYGFNTNIALWLVTCCTLAYKNEEVVQAVCCHVWDMCGFQFIDNEQTDTQGFVMYNQEFLVICFRGTESIRDWMTNLNFVQVAASQFPQRYLKSGVRVHNGFNEALKSVWPQINDFVSKALRSYPHLKLYICGHSLGGALANLCFGYLTLSDTPRTVEAVYTIGQPRAGNKKYREQLEVSNPNTTYIRITNNQDCVPSLAGGQHCGLHVHFDAAGTLSFDPPVWKKAMQKAQSLQGSAASMSYAGIADHSGPVYRKLIEGHWVKSEFSQVANNDGSFNLCEKILYLMDMLQEDVKSVRRYKIQFRAILGNILNVRPIIVTIEDYLAMGVDDSSRSRLKSSLLTFFELLSKTKKEVVARHSKKSMLQSQNEKSSLKSFNSKMQKLAASFQDVVTTLHTTLQRATCKPSAKIQSQYAWAPPPQLPKYDQTAIQQIKFRAIDFAAMGKKPQKGQSPHVSQMLEEAEHLLEAGKVENALRILEQLDSGSSSTIVGSLSGEDKALVSFLKAKAHAKLHHHQEAVQALAAASGTGMMSSSMMQDAAFGTLKNNDAFTQMQKQWGSSGGNQPQAAAASSLNNFELHMLSDLFDEADDNGDNFLTTEELSGLITSMGGIETILDGLGWIEKPGNTPQEQSAYAQEISKATNTLYGIMNDMKTKYRDAVDLDQFVVLMSRFSP